MSEQKAKKPVPRSKILQQEQTAKLIADAKAAKARGEKIGWATGVFPCEPAEAMGITVLYPENFSAGIAARHQADKYLEYAEGKLRYPSDICSYARINFAICDMLLTGAEGSEDIDFVLPDFLLSNNNTCGQVCYWYENLARILNIPVFVVDTVYNYDYYGDYDEVPPHKVKYIQSQIESTIKGLEELTGKKMDPDRFMEVQRRAQINRKLFEETCNNFAHMPSPCSGFDLFNYMACMVMCRGKESTTEILTALKEEMDANVAAGTSTFPAKETHRVFWEGIANWPYLSHNLKTLKENEVNMVATGYVKGWDLQYEPGNMYELARAYNYSSSNNNSMPLVVKRRSDLIKQFKCDGVIYHLNKSCKAMDFHQFEGQRLIYENTGVPFMRFDADQSDGRVFSKAQYETRLQGLVEVMAERKKEG